MNHAHESSDAAAPQSMTHRAASMEHAGMHHAMSPQPHAGHGAHADHTGHEEKFRKRFWISLALSLPVLVLSPALQEWFGFSIPAFPFSEWIAPFFAVLVFVYGGLPFLQMARPELQNRQPGMMTLISLALLVAFVYSVAALFFNLGMGFFWELVTLIDVMLLGHWLEMRSVRQASGALNELAKLLPDTAERVRADESVEQIPANELRPRDLVLVRPGSNVPADGIVEQGQSEVNEALLTGESKPAPKRAGDQVIAGALNGAGSLRVRVTAAADDTALAGIMRLVAQAQQSKSRTQILADRAAGWLFYIALAFAALTAIAWTLALGFNATVIERVATVLVIACPHALGLAIPLVVAISTSLAARNGILVRDRLALEQARAIDTVIFDKTGTLTQGAQGIVGIAAAETEDANQALALAAALEGDSEHMIARALRQAAQAKNLTLPPVAQFEALKGRGVRAQANGETAYVGGPQLLQTLNLAPTGVLKNFTAQADARGQTAVYLVRGERIAAAFALADAIRPESKDAVKRLRELNIRVAMLTGDSRAVAQSVAAELGIDEFFAQVLPENKDQHIALWQKQGRHVAMVGDGVNDAPALARADVGIAIGSGTDVAVESAGIILVQSNPLDVVKIIELSRASYHKMAQNLFWAAGYNVVALPLAAGLLAPFGILLSPAVGALFMSVSTIIVALNAQLLRRVRLAN